MATARPRAPGSVQVAVRVRPLMRHEDGLPAVRTEGSVLSAVLSAGGGKEALRNYEFDRVCGSDTSQAQFFEACGVKRLVDAALEGINASVFAYGQTGALRGVLRKVCAPNGRRHIHPTRAPH